MIVVFAGIVVIVIMFYRRRHCCFVFAPSSLLSLSLSLSIIIVAVVVFISIDPQTPRSRSWPMRMRPMDRIGEVQGERLWLVGSIQSSNCLVLRFFVAVTPLPAFSIRCARTPHVPLPFLFSLPVLHQTSQAERRSGTDRELHANSERRQNPGQIDEQFMPFYYKNLHRKSPHGERQNFCNKTQLVGQELME